MQPDFSGASYLPLGTGFSLPRKESRGSLRRGCPDVVSFSKYIEGTLYVTVDLTDSEQLSNEDSNYELAIAHEGDEQWGVDFICQLAFNTLTKTINDGDTMDISLDTPADSTIDGFIFRRIAKFDVLGHPCSVLCCIGITESELKFCQENGSAKLTACVCWPISRGIDPAAPIVTVITL